MSLYCTSVEKTKHLYRVDFSKSNKQDSALQSKMHYSHNQSLLVPLEGGSYSGKSKFLAKTITFKFKDC